MDLSVCILSGIGIYFFTCIVIKLLNNFFCSWDFEKQSILKCLDKKDYLEKIIKKMYWREKIKKILFNLEYFLTGYTKELLYWNRNCNHWIRGIVISSFNICILYFVTNYNIVLNYLIIHWNSIFNFLSTMVDLVKKIISWINANKMISTAILVIILTLIYRKHKGNFEEVLKDKKKKDIEIGLELNCKIAKEIYHISYWIYCDVIDVFVDRDKKIYSSYLSEYMFEQVFLNIDKCEKSYHKRNYPREIYDAEYFKIDENNLERIETEINEKYREYRKSGGYYDTSVWMKYNLDIISLYSFVDIERDELKLKPHYFTNEWVKNKISAYRKSWSVYIDYISEKESLQENDIKELEEKYIEIQDSVNTMLLLTIKDQFSMQKYRWAVAEIMKIKDKSIIESFIKAKDIV